MPYITTFKPRVYKQISFDDILMGTVKLNDCFIGNETTTITRQVDIVPVKFASQFNINEIYANFKQFSESTKNLREKDRQSLYRSFKIPKKTHGFRQINAPEPELDVALRTLKLITESSFKSKDSMALAPYHTSAYAYIKHRSTIDCVKRHQYNKSRWFAKLDLHDFFGSSKKEFVMDMLSKIYPLSNVVSNFDDGAQILNDAFDLCFLNDGLPQGTPISPLITNIIMIPIDHEINRLLRVGENKDFVYTRYADDIIISSKYDFRIKDIESLVSGVFEKFNAPFELNKEKTRYGSSSGRNWNLGVMLNKDNEITIGAEKKKRFKAMITNFIASENANDRWDIDDVQQFAGLISYYHMVEPEKIDEIIEKYNKKFSFDLMGRIKEILKGN